MERWNGLDEVPADGTPSVVTIGNFDGVHRGHLAVLSLLVETARARHARSVAITFDPHPTAVLRPEVAPPEVLGVDGRLRLLAGTGLDAVLVMEFTRELAAWEPERFVREVLVDALRACTVVVGRDTRFGRRNAGDVETLRELGQRHGFGVLVVEDLRGPSAEAGRRWSSTWLREAIATGDVGQAAEILGRRHRLTGTVVHGDHRGRELGFPTANLGTPILGMVPADGVYAGYLVLRPHDADGGEALPAAVSIGTNPTFDGTEQRVEAYVLDRDDLDLYGRTVAVDFVRMLRPTLRFSSVADLVERMDRDVSECRTVLGTPVDRV